MDATTTEVRMAQWTGIIQQWSESGMTKKDWCTQNEVNLKAFYYWQRKIRNRALSLSVTKEPPATVFTEITVPDVSRHPAAVDPGVFCPAVRISKSTLKIEISNAVSDELLSMIAKVIRHAE